MLKSVLGPMKELVEVRAGRRPSGTAQFPAALGHRLAQLGDQFLEPATGVAAVMKLFPLPHVEHRFPEGWYAKVTMFPLNGRAKQHKHDSDHLTVVTGAFRMWVGDENGVSLDSPYISPWRQGPGHVCGGVWHICSTTATASRLE